MGTIAAQANEGAKGKQSLSAALLIPAFLLARRSAGQSGPAPALRPFTLDYPAALHAHGSRSATASICHRIQ